MKQKKLVHLEIIRIIALICVVYNHIAYVLFIQMENSLDFLIALILSILCEMGVPLFFMVSGAVLLKKEESWGDVYKNRVLRITEVIVLFTVVRYFYECYVIKTMDFSPMQLVKSILTCNILHPYWFLYAYLSILLLLPVFRVAIQNLDKQGKKNLLILILIFYMIIPMKSILINQEWKVVLMLDEEICYLFLGYYIENEMEKKDFTIGKKIAAVFGAIVAVIITIGLVVKPQIAGGQFAVDMIPTLVMSLSCAVFFLIRCKAEDLGRSNERVEKLVVWVGSCVFGVYLIEDYLRVLTANLYGKLGMSTSDIKACILATVVVVVFGTIISFFMKKIPMLKKLL